MLARGPTDESGVIWGLKELGLCLELLFHQPTCLAPSTTETQMGNQGCLLVIYCLVQCHNCPITILSGMATCRSPSTQNAQGWDKMG